MEKDFIINGIHVGEHSFEVSAILDEIRERVLPYGYDFVTIRPSKQEIPESAFLEWAEFLSSHGIYFVFLYTIQNAPDGKEAHLTPAIVEKMRKIAGKYYLGDMIGEVGSDFASKLPGYFKNLPERLVPQNAPDMAAAKAAYEEKVGKLIEIEHRLGVPEILSVEATMLNHYNLEAGVTIPMCELMCGTPEPIVASLRGAARAYGAKLFGTYIAEEWYGGLRHEDGLKRHRLAIAYRYAYLAGSNAFCLESGDEALASFGTSYPKEHELCEDYRREARAMTELIRSDDRPAGGPDVKLAFLQGNLDSFGEWGQSSVWSQFDRPEWAFGDAEHSWRILGEMGAARPWNEPASYGFPDLSAAPAYGQYDILPAAAPAEALSRYDVLLFTGWNTMTDAIYQNLLSFVRAGGILLSCAAHMNENVRRDGAFLPFRSGDLSELFGCRLTGKTFLTNRGYKFETESLVPGLLYPGTKNKTVDPIYSAGAARYAEAVPTDGSVAAFLSDSFLHDETETPPAVIEKKLGRGYAILLTAADYPGNAAVYPAYRAVVRELVTRSHRLCPIRIYGSDRLRFSVYRGGEKIYLLNTDFSSPIFVTVERGGKAAEYRLAPSELKILG